MCSFTIVTLNQIDTNGRVLSLIRLSYIADSNPSKYLATTAKLNGKIP